MKFSLYLTVLAFMLCAALAGAGPVTWTLNGVVFGDGGTASGSLTFDADAGVACSGGTTPCGVFSAVDIVTTLGSALPGNTYTFVCGQDVATCGGVSPDSSEVLLLASNAADQTGLPAFALFFTPAAGPPAGLSDAGGLISLVSNGLEAPCGSSACSAPATPSRTITAGSIVSPEPASLGMLLAGLGAIGIARRRSGGVR